MTPRAPTTFRRWSAVAVVVAVSATLGACSSDATSSSSAATTSIPGGPGARAVSTSTSGDLFVVEASAVSAAPVGDGFQLVMEISGEVLAFTDRPARGADRIDPATFVDQWTANGFAADPPNAALTGTSGGAAVDIAVELADPSWDAAAGRLTVTATPIGADTGTTIPTQLDTASLFIDDAQQSADLNITSMLTIDVQIRASSPDAVATGFDPSRAWLLDVGDGPVSGDTVTIPGLDGLVVSLVNPTPGQTASFVYTLAMNTQDPDDPGGSSPAQSSADPTTDGSGAADIATVTVEFAADGTSSASFTPLVPAFASGGPVGQPVAIASSVPAGRYYRVILTAR